MNVRPIGSFIFVVVVCLTVTAVEVTVDFENVVGRIKPVNGVGQPPMVGALGDWSMLHYLKEAGIPYSRLHDVGGWLGGGLYVDIPNLFPDFDANENNPENYRFAYTDSLMKALAANGVEPFFRLGVTIENFAGRGFPPVNIAPPKDYAKWARIAEHVIRHYTEGWADGFSMKVKYWEIWNEPDNYEIPLENCMWRGDWNSYLHFYGTVAPYLKAKFPHLKIGGYGSCGFYAATGADHVKVANSSPRMTYFIDCFTNFLFCAKTKHWPLDFFSFHSYSLPDDVRQQVVYARSKLDEYGFVSTEMCFNEWLPEPSLAALGTVSQAALIAGELVDLQNGSCDMAMIYDARCGVGSFSPLFNPLTCKPHKAYYAFMAFNELRKAGTSIASKSDDLEIRVAAAKGNGMRTVLVVNISNSEKELKFNGFDMDDAVCRIVDETHTWDVVPMFRMIPSMSFAVFTWPYVDMDAMSNGNNKGTCHAPLRP